MDLSHKTASPRPETPKVGSLTAASLAAHTEASSSNSKRTSNAPAGAAARAGAPSASATAIAAMEEHARGGSVAAAAARLDNATRQQRAAENRAKLEEEVRAHAPLESEVES